MANTTNYNWETPDDTDLVKDGAAAIRTLGNSIDTTTKALNPETTLGDIAYRSATSNTNTRLPIGTAGQILAVSGGVPAWINNDQGDITEVQAGTGISVASGTGPIPIVTNTVATAFDAAGDLVYGTGADTFTKLSLGTAGKVLKVNSGATAPEWAVDPTTDVVTTAGDLIYGTAADTVARLGIGTAGQVLKVNSGATAPEWGAAGASAFVGARVYASATLTINNNTATAIAFDSESFDTDAFHSTSVNNSRFTIPSGKDGYYRITFSTYWLTLNASGRRRYAIYKNGVETVAFEGAASSTSYMNQTGTTTMNLVATDYIESFCLQNSGGTMDINAGSTATFFEIQYLGA
jgi:hypothetical protein